MDILKNVSLINIYFSLSSKFFSRLGAKASNTIRVGGRFQISRQRRSEDGEELLKGGITGPYLYIFKDFFHLFKTERERKSMSKGEGEKQGSGVGPDPRTMRSGPETQVPPIYTFLSIPRYL